MLTALLFATLAASNPAHAIAATVKASAQPAPRVELAINETEGTTTINGKAYRCVTTDFGGRYDTVCTPAE